MHDTGDLPRKTQDLDWSAIESTIEISESRSLTRNHSIKMILLILLNGYHSMDITQWTSLNGCHSMDITHWISLNGYHTMDITQWISLNGYHSMDICQWMSLHGHHSMNTNGYQWISRNWYRAIDITQLFTQLITIHRLIWPIRFTRFTNNAHDSTTIHVWLKGDLRDSYKIQTRFSVSWCVLVETEISPSAPFRDSTLWGVAQVGFCLILDRSHSCWHKIKSIATLFDKVCRHLE
jgi:hypothetical protein